MPVDIAPKHSWADEVSNELDEQVPYSTTDENGVQTFVEFRTENGKRIKSVRKIKKVLVTEHVNKTVAARKKWAKFGLEKGSKPGPDTRTTTVGEQVFLQPTPKLQSEPEVSETDKMKQALAASKGIQCRRCKGDHFTSKCPYKDTLPMDQPTTSASAAPGAGISSAASGAVDSPPSTPAPAKYVPPGMRGKAAGMPSDGSRFPEKRDDSNTLRVTNLSEDVRESDVQDLFRGFGSLARVFVARDRETNMCKGYAFVSFHMKEDAARALQKLNGFGYDNLILRVEWATPQQ